jgi:hypothetical protein
MRQLGSSLAHQDRAQPSATGDVQQIDLERVIYSNTTTVQYNKIQYFISIILNIHNLKAPPRASHRVGT